MLPTSPLFLPFAVTALLMCVGAVALFVYARSRKKDREHLHQSTNRLEAANQQLRASNQQLQATEQQLRATNQQLQAHGQALRTSEERYRMMFENMGNAVAVYEAVDDGRDFVIRGFNQAAEKIEKTPRAGILGKRVTEVFAGVREFGILDVFARVWKTGQSEHYPMKLYKDEHLVGWRDNFVYKLPSGEVVAVYSDETVRMQAELGLRESEARFKLFYENAPVAYQSLDDKGCLLDVNGMWLLSLGYAREEVIGRCFSDFLISSEAGLFAERFARLKEVKRADGLEFELLRKDGSRIVVLFYTRVDSDEKGNFLRTHCVFHDITERKRTLEELQKTQRLESLGILAGGIAHDFNNLLAGVFGYVDMARQTSDPNSEAADYLNKAMSAFQRAKDLTQQLLTFARGGAPMTTAASLEDVVRAAVDLALSGSNIQRVVRVHDRPLIAEVDAGQINQVVNNIILNARQAMPMGGTIEVDLRRKDARDLPGYPLAPGMYAELTVRDQGTGIPAEYLDKIFDPFFTTKNAGSGLGLATSFSIIKRHHGHVTVESQSGKGSAFRVYLPLTTKSSGIQTGDEGRPIKGTGRILLMDDEDLIRDMGAEMLKQLGYDVVCARDGGAAVRAYVAARDDEEPFAAVILDLTIPGGKGGVETLRELLHIDPAVRAIVSSGYSEDPVMSAPRVHGFAATVKKPYKLAELGRAVRDAVEG